MPSGNRLWPSTALLLAALIMELSVSCSNPLVWNADLKSFVDDGTSVVSLKNLAVQCGGVTAAVVPSGSEVVASLEISNPRSLELSCTARCADDSLLASPPAVTIVSPQRIDFSFTPALQAERKDLVFTLEITAPKIDRNYGSQTIKIHCNTPPGSVESSLDAALDEHGRAFAAFRLPGTATDDDLSQLDITYRRADGTGTDTFVSLGANDACMLDKKLCVDGRDLLATDCPLNRYYQPAGITTGDDYIFSVVVVDSEGLRSASATITSNSTLYSVTYDGNENTGGEAPVDPATYRQTKPVTVLGPGTLQRTGYSFTGWNTVADGSGTAYAPGDSFSIGAANVVLYAQWSINSYTVSFDSQGGSAAAPMTATYGSVLTLPAAPVRVGHTFVDWNSAADGTGTSYAAGASFTVPAANVTLYARWSVNSYTITFDSRGGSPVAPVTAAYGSVLTLPAAPVWPGYTFLGWNSAPDGSGSSYAAGADFTVPAADLALYAQWVENAVVTVTFIMNPSYASINFSSSTVTVTSGSVLELTTSLTGATNWHWYLDDVLDATQTTSTFRWNTTGVQPGQHIINVDAVYGGYACTGSIRVTVSY